MGCFLILGKPGLGKGLQCGETLLEIYQKYLLNTFVGESVSGALVTVRGRLMSSSSANVSCAP